MCGAKIELGKWQVGHKKKTPLPFKQAEFTILVFKSEELLA